MTANSMIATILQREPQNTRQCIAMWRQLGDILAQRGMQLGEAEILQSLRALASLRSKVPEAVRRDSALSIAAHGRFAPLVALYANDVIPVAAAMLQNANLPEQDWLALLPATNDIARSILAGRSDLPAEVRRALISLGAGSVALPSAQNLTEEAHPSAIHEQAPFERDGNFADPDSWDAAVDYTRWSPFEDIEADIDMASEDVVEAEFESYAPSAPIANMAWEAASEAKEDGVFVAASQPLSQISELVRRIDRFKTARTAVPPPPKPEDISAIEAEILAGVKGRAGRQRAAKPNVTQFCFETTDDGAICWAEGIAPPAIIGLSIGEAALGSEPGTDGVAAGAFRQRAEIIGARMRLAGSADISGEWRISADPIFDSSSGQFQGYRGTARRPLRSEHPYGQPIENEANDSIRQLIHELRSPLNAISGFAQIISGQMFGPVSGSYRALAETIVEDALAVQNILEDLEIASGHDRPTQATTDHSDVVDLVDIFAYVSKDLQGLLREQQVGLSITEEGGPFMARADVHNVRRMVGRLLTALIDISEPNSLLVAQLIADLTQGDMVQLRIMRPTAIRFAEASQLLDPGYSPDGEAPGADILSLGFSLRLVGSLAAANDGRLEIAANSLILHLPLATATARDHLTG